VSDNQTFQRQYCSCHDLI